MLKTHIEKDGSIDLTLLSDLSKETIANFALEGIHPSKETLQDLILLDTGEITGDQFFEKAISRVKP
jgi:hypothetical protein